VANFPNLAPLDDRFVTDVSLACRMDHKDSLTIVARLHRLLRTTLHCVASERGHVTIAQRNGR